MKPEPKALQQIVSSVNEGQRILMNLIGKHVLKRAVSSEFLRNHANVTEIYGVCSPSYADGWEHDAQKLNLDSYWILNDVSATIRKHQLQNEF